jgi:CubicO group peptidase (beta-lactamase class C family)
MKTVGVERSAVPFVRHEPWTEIVFPAGGVRTTSTDLAKWAIALQKQKLVNKDSLEQLWKPQPQQDGTYRGFGSTINGYGLGWPSARRAAHPAITPVGGARAAIFIYPEDDLTIVVLTNLMGASPEKFVDKIASLYIPGFAIEK